MSETQTWSVLKLLEWTTKFLREHGSDSPRLEGEVLLAHARGCRRIDLYTQFDSVPDARVLAQFRELVRARSEGKPVAYLTGRKEFYSLDFAVTPDVLIPRPDTEHLVVACLDKCKAVDPPSGVSVVDVGTGSGAVAVSIAKHLPHAAIFATDVSPAALAVAQKNAAAHHLQDRITFLQGDLLDPLPPAVTPTVIVSNPPYVTTSEWEQLSRDVKDFEPRLALEAGPTGTEIIARLIPQAAARLSSGGYLMFEISPMLEAECKSLVEASGALTFEATIKDLSQHARVIVARKSR